MIKKKAAPVASAKSQALQDKLKQSEEALIEAKKTIAEQQQREKELKKLLELNSLVEGDSAVNSLMEAKTQALNNIHSQKVRSLMKSIHQLQEQVSVMKSQDKEHRRSALIQSLRKKQREQDLTIDVLKETLQAKVSEFNDSLDSVNEFILKKTLSGPKRFRPKTREELELDFVELDKKYKRALANLKKTKATQAVKADDDDAGDEPAEPAAIAAAGFQFLGSWRLTLEVDMTALEEEISRLKMAVTVKDTNLQAQVDEIAGLHRRVEELLLTEDKLERAKAKYSASKDDVKKLEEDAIRLIQEKERESEMRQQVEIELKFFRDTHEAQSQSGDTVKLELLERIKTTQAHEAELQTQLEEQQRKWAVDRSTIMAQMRTQEKQIQAIEAQTKMQAELIAKLTTERDACKTQLGDAQKEITALKAQGPASGSNTKDKELLEEREQKLKALEKQIIASKLLARQHKKEKEQMLLEMDKLRTLVAAAAPATDASRVLAQAQIKSSTEGTLSGSKNITKESRVQDTAPVDSNGDEIPE
ncbi:Aste57867_24514 [Aphanomyces stellatus]|uniref:Aste57867_24514 protein n=1 Tax=Aphanomyces stellatus TaxID=120398 RepID=A0A485LS77_9STRA|nr:hypothetical protein As57867_024437 [Aphanomyces stellatus]VFU01153.1 Aste57867_24514 [Aphanomyces stellatus]